MIDIHFRCQTMKLLNNDWRAVRLLKLRNRVVAELFLSYLYYLFLMLITKKIEEIKKQKAIAIKI